MSRLRTLIKNESLQTIGKHLQIGISRFDFGSRKTTIGLERLVVYHTKIKYSLKILLVRYSLYFATLCDVAKLSLGKVSLF